MFRLTKKAMALVALCAVFLTACVIFGGCSNTASSISGGVSSAAGSGTPSQCKHENVVTLDAEDATCTETGLTEGKKCSDCDVVIVERTTVDMKAHTWGEWTQTIAPTEDDDGQEKATCSVCNTEDTRTVPALEHTHKYSDTWTHNDTHHWHPTTCNHDDVAGILTKTEHSWDAGIETKAPTCVVKGVKTYTCTCGKTKTEYIAATGKHTEITISDVAATCTKTGKTAGKKCSVCGLVTVAQTSVDKKEHNFSEVKMTKPVTTLSDGEKSKICTACSLKKDTETIPAQAGYVNILNEIDAITALRSLQENDAITIKFDSSVTTVSASLRDTLENANKKVTLDLSESGIDISTDILQGYPRFFHCTSLIDVKLSNETTRIGMNTFDGCTSLTSIEIPSSVTSIGRAAFYGCTSLTSIEIPNGVTSIEGWTFYGCTSLNTIKYTGTKAEWNKNVTSIFFGSSDWRKDIPAKGVTCSDGKTYAFAKPTDYFSGTLSDEVIE